MVLEAKEKLESNVCADGDVLEVDKKALGVYAMLSLFQFSKF